MGWKRFRRRLSKNVGRQSRSVRKAVKRGGRNFSRIQTKIAPYKALVVGAVATYTLGPAVGGVAVGIQGETARYWGGVNARAKGVKGHAAKQAGRDLRKQVYKYGAIGVGLGFAGSVTAGFAGVGSGPAGNAGFGVVGSDAIWGTPFGTGEGITLAGGTAPKVGVAVAPAAIGSGPGVSSIGAGAAAVKGGIGAGATTALGVGAGAGVGGGIGAGAVAAAGTGASVGSTLLGVGEKLAPGVLQLAGNYLMGGQKPTVHDASSIFGDIGIGGGGDNPGGTEFGAEGESEGFGGSDLFKVALIGFAVYAGMKVLKVA